MRACVRATVRAPRFQNMAGRVLQDNSWSAIMLHSSVTFLFFAMVTVMEPGLKAMASVSMPSKLTGLAFGLLNSISGLGNMIGNPTATWLYVELLGSPTLFRRSSCAFPMLVDAVSKKFLCFSPCLLTLFWSLFYSPSFSFFLFFLPSFFVVFFGGVQRLCKC
jgi:hypothetical protein